MQDTRQTLLAMADHLLLRNAAGAYWLINLDQPGVPYKKPLKLNDSGALIWGLLTEGMTVDEMAARVADDGYPKEDAARDIQDFIDQILKALCT